MTLKQVLKHFKSKADIARALNIQPQALTNWNKHIPMRRQYELERITEGKLKARVKR